MWAFAVRRLVRALGGDLIVEGTPGSGLTFAVGLPVVAGARSEPPGPAIV